MKLAEGCIDRRLRQGYLTRRQVAEASGLTVEEVTTLETGEVQIDLLDRYNKALRMSAGGRNWRRFWVERLDALSQAEYYLLCHGTLNERLLWAVEQFLTAVDRQDVLEVFDCTAEDLDRMLAGQKEIPISFADRLDAIGLTPNWFAFGYGVQALESAMAVWRMPGAGPYLIAVRKAMEAGVPADILERQVGILIDALHCKES